MLWTLGEYLLHRLDMHGRRSRGATSVEHRRHHAEVDVPVPSVATWSGAAIVGAALAWWTHPAVALGWLAGHGAYDAVHRSIHARAPRGRYGRLVRRQHLAHHFGATGRNFGVTSPVWDVVLGTYRRPGTVRLPVDTAPPWLAAGPTVEAPDADGPPPPPWADDYEVLDRRTGPARPNGGDPGPVRPGGDGAGGQAPPPVGRSAGGDRRGTGHG